MKLKKLIYSVALVLLVVTTQSFAHSSFSVNAYKQNRAEGVFVQNDNYWNDFKVEIQGPQNSKSENDFLLSSLYESSSIGRFLNDKNDFLLQSYSALLENQKRILFRFIAYLKN